VSQKGMLSITTNGGGEPRLTVLRI